MAALVVDHLLRSQHVADEPVTFIYCNYKRQSEQSAKHMLSSILRQIIDIQPGVPKPVQDLYASHTTKRITPSLNEIKQVCEAVSEDLHRLTIIIDALDECEARARHVFLSAVEMLRRQCGVRLLATSRPIATVQSHAIFLGKPTLEVRASGKDLEKYIHDFNLGGPSETLENAGICVLALGTPLTFPHTVALLMIADGGGIRGLSQLYILQSIIERVNRERKKFSKDRVEPWELFDLICGTGTGG